MSINDYSEDEDYYSQGFEKKGVVSIWVGLNDRSNEPDADTLQDLCGVGYYRSSDQEGNCFNFEDVGLDKLLIDLSYSKSFLSDALVAAKNKGISSARWVTLQYDFDYNPKKIHRKIADDPVFIGSFYYSTAE